jgi:hypothetical protein
MSAIDINVNKSRKCNGLGSHDQIIHFIGGEKRLIQGVVAVWENEMTHIIDYLGVEYIVNKSNVLFTERFSNPLQEANHESVTSELDKLRTRKGAYRKTKKD